MTLHQLVALLNDNLWLVAAIALVIVIAAIVSRGTPGPGDTASIVPLPSAGRPRGSTARHVARLVVAVDGNARRYLQRALTRVVDLALVASPMAATNVLRGAVETLVAVEPAWVAAGTAHVASSPLDGQTAFTATVAESLARRSAAAARAIHGVPDAEGSVVVTLVVGTLEPAPLDGATRDAAALRRVLDALAALEPSQVAASRCSGRRRPATRHSRRATSRRSIPASRASAPACKAGSTVSTAAARARPTSPSVRTAVLRSRRREGSLQGVLRSRGREGSLQGVASAWNRGDREAGWINRGGGACGPVDCP